MKYAVTALLFTWILSCNVEDRLLVVEYSYDFMQPKVRTKQMRKWSRPGDTLRLYGRYFAYNYEGNETHFEKEFKRIFCDSLRSARGYTYIYFEFFQQPFASQKYIEGDHITSDEINQVYVYKYDEIKDANHITVYERSDNGYFDDTKKVRLGCLPRRRLPL